ncbi:glycosyltransferase family 2 protein [Gimesia sp.]|uniref:glycosyltransferase family 2 protein n=1 Tax=Gimesia sp. TaxID=2024833 RepID=UPI0032ECFA1E
MKVSVSKSGPLISVVTPVYGAHDLLEELYARLIQALSQITEDYEIIMVNDASPDDSWCLIQRFATQNSRLKGVNLSRNFGQHHAITAGLEFARGKWVVVMDCDLQDQPEEIPKLYQTAQQGFDVVVGIRHTRQDTTIKKLCSRYFYKVFAYFTNTRIEHQIGNFGIYSRKVIRSILKFKEQTRSFGLFVIWAGFRRIEIPIEHAKRPTGKSTYNFPRMISLAFNSIIAYSNKLLILFVKLGFLLAGFSFLFTLWLLFRYVIWGIPVIGWTSLIVSIYLSTGLMIMVVGAVGIYIGKIFDEVKGRPLYLIESTTFELDSDDE